MVPKRIKNYNITRTILHLVFTLAAMDLQDVKKTDLCFLLNFARDLEPTRNLVGSEV